MQLIDNLYGYPWMGMGNNCNSYFFANVLPGNNPHIIIDPGHTANEMGEPCLDNLITAIKTDGFDVSDIGLIINTHTHIDHYQSNRGLQQMIEKASNESNKPQIALSKEADEYRLGSGARWIEQYGDSIKFEPDFYLTEGPLSFGEGENKLDLEIIDTPGHGPGHVCIYWPKNKVLITGDIVFIGSVGRTDLPGGDGNMLKASIEKLSTYDTEYILPGHATEYGGMLKGKENALQNFSFIKTNYFPII
ncbi:MAG: MBL fold metallo-hydrolase [Chloroflexi bacterium]|jgi:hydroxyacylglutathione hydrolase|nr:MBL fold metallo-hydrolase [Chloroflexota bacterium]MBT7081769.1 MBL fold metallo-hydrolase [Chloroflexota bacterium]MBT7289409.1 MBL fold metallo-hydrolase [Chloroflexota bacterium]